MLKSDWEFRRRHFQWSTRKRTYLWVKYWLIFHFITCCPRAINLQCSNVDSEIFSCSCLISTFESQSYELPYRTHLSITVPCRNTKVVGSTQNFLGSGFVISNTVYILTWFLMVPSLQMKDIWYFDDNLRLRQWMQWMQQWMEVTHAQNAARPIK